ncbi:MAG: hypothetical protein LBT97_06205 [Planctomycetota bacterium]|nr:hypothetical protein [Planctomycetota bacterium]
MPKPVDFGDAGAFPNPVRAGDRIGEKHQEAAVSFGRDENARAIRDALSFAAYKASDFGFFAKAKEAQQLFPTILAGRSGIVVLGTGFWRMEHPWRLNS